jgi:DHA1 family inner membrane transport protein
MASVTSNRSWLVPVFALFLATFAVCTAELMIAGLLPAIAHDLDVDIPTAGLLITGYALGVAIAGPILALLTTGVLRRSLLIAVMAVFVAGNILCALSGTYWMLLGSRLLIACCQGLFFGVAMVIASRLAPEGRQGSAISLVLAGVTLANILGVPVGTALGNTYGWHTTFWVIAGAGALALAGLVILIPSAVEPKRGKEGLRAELRAAVQPAVLFCYGIVIMFMIAVFTLFAYLVPLLTTVSGVPLEYIPLVLFGMGFVGFFGNLAGGRLGDWNSNVTMIGILAIFAVITFGMVAVVTSTWGMVAALWAAWFIGFGFLAPVQSRILKEAATAPNFASTLISTAFNIGIASGAALGGAAIAAGWGYATLPLIDASFLGLALVGTLLLTGYDRGRRPVVVANPAE